MSTPIAVMAKMRTRRCCRCGSRRKRTHGPHSHHMLAGASMLFESSFPDQVMQPAAHHAPVKARKPHGSACTAQPSAAAAASRPEPTAALHCGHHVIELQHAVSAPADIGVSSSKGRARQSQLVVFANGSAAHGTHGDAADAPVARPPSTLGGPAATGAEAAPLGDGHLLSSRDGEEDLEEQPLLPDPGAAWTLSQMHYSAHRRMRILCFGAPGWFTQGSHRPVKACNSSVIGDRHSLL